MSEPSAEPQERGHRRLLELACLIAFLLLLHGSSWHRLDLNVWDEAHYLRQGRLLAQGLWGEADYAWSLPLAGLHALLERVGTPVPLQLDLIRVGCSLGACLSLWWALGALLGRTAAFLAICWWALSSQALYLEGVDASSYTLGLALGAVAVGLVARGRLVAAIPVMIVATLNRGEVALWLALAGALWILGRKRQTPRASGVPGWLAAGVGTALFVMLNHGWRARARSWFAFRQHFAWSHPDQAAAAEVFPGADSVVGALRAEPAAFLDHLLRNLAMLPGVLGRLLLDVVPWWPVMQAALVAAVCLLAVAGLLRSRAWPDRPGSAAAPTARLFLIASLAIAPVSVLLLPRPSLLLPLLPLVLCLLFGWAAVGWRTLIARVPALRPRPGWLPVVVVLAAVPLAVSYGDQLAEPPTHRSAVELLRRHAGGSSSLLASRADVLLLYAELDGLRSVDPTSPGFEAEHGRVELASVVERFAPDLLLDTPLLRRGSGAGNPLDTLIRGGGWQLLERCGQVALYRREP